MKKKLLALMLVAAMLMGMSMTTIAAPGVDEGSFTKTYTVTGGTTVPTEVIKFNVEENTTGTVPTLVVGEDNEFSVTGGTATEYTVPFKVTLNGASAGTYKYTISEVPGETQGVTYADETIGVEVLVTLPDGKTPTITQIGVSKADKEVKFTNDYDLGSLTVSKKVTGNLGDQTKKFDMTVTFTSDKEVKSEILNGKTPLVWTKAEGATVWTATAAISLAHREDITFNNIPAGVTYVVEESDKYSVDTDKNGVNGYDAPVYNYSDEESKTIAQSDKDTVEVTNNKSATIDTGLIINNFPYILALAAVALVAVAFMRKRRSF